MHEPSNFFVGFAGEMRGIHLNCGVGAEVRNLLARRLSIKLFEREDGLERIEALELELSAFENGAQYGVEREQRFGQLLERVPSRSSANFRASVCCAVNR